MLLSFSLYWAYCALDLILAILDTRLRLFFSQYFDINLPIKTYRKKHNEKDWMTYIAMLLGR